MGNLKYFKKNPMGNLNLYFVIKNSIIFFKYLINFKFMVKFDLFFISFMCLITVNIIYIKKIKKQFFKIKFMFFSKSRI